MNMMMEVIRTMERELQECLSNGNMSMQDVKLIGEVMDIIKDAETVMAMRGSGDGYSNGYSGEHYVRGHYSRGYDDGYSGNRYSNGMEHDGMYSGRSYGSGSYGDGYSGQRRNPSNGRYMGYSRDDMMERTKSQIERLMNESQNEQVREALQGALSRL